jgi:TonB family protein
MWDVTGLDDLLDAVEAFDAGRERSEAVEHSIRDALSNGAVTRGEALQALRSAVRRRAAGGMIERLGLEADHSPEPAAPQSAKPARAATKSRYTGTRISAKDTAPVAAPAPQPPASAKNAVPVAAPPPPPPAPQLTAREPPPPPPPPAPQLTATTAESSERDLRPGYPNEGATLPIERLMVGQTLGGRYRLERELRRDGLGTVYFAHDLEANKSPVAVNVLRPEFRSFSEALTLLRAEVRVTRMLRHPHIARVYSLNADRLGAYLVTEYLEGRTLAAHLQDIGEALPVNDARSLVHDVCAALAYAHDLEVVHGNLQPAHVFITPSGRAKLLDFGLERAAGTRNGRFDSRRIGGLAMSYASPEMLEGRAPDPRDDVYSLACIIYTMLSGVHPFDLRSALEARRLGLAMEPLAGLSRDQNAAIARGLAFESVQRSPSVTALLADLGWDFDPPAVAAPAQIISTPASAVVAPVQVDSAPALAPAPAVSPPAYVDSAPAPAVAAPPTAPRVARRGGFRLPLPPIEMPTEQLPSVELPSMHLPSMKSTSRALPAERVSRRYVIPALIALALVGAGIGIALVYRGHAPSVVQSPTASSSSTAPASLSPPPAPPIAGSAPATSAPASSSSTAVPIARQGAVRQPAKPPPVADTKSVSPVQTGPRSAILRPLPKAAAEMADNDNCPYPRAAVDQGLTGAVLMLVHVASDGKPMTTKVDKTSGYDVLDQAAVRCIEQFGRFPAAPDGSPDGYWGRVRFRWFIDI